MSTRFTSGLGDSSPMQFIHIEESNGLKQGYVAYQIRSTAWSRDRFEVVHLVHWGDPLSFMTKAIAHIEEVARQKKVEWIRVACAFTTSKQVVQLFYAKNYTHFSSSSTQKPDQIQFERWLTPTSSSSSSSSSVSIPLVKPTEGPSSPVSSQSPRKCKAKEPEPRSPQSSSSSSSSSALEGPK